jgi:hypothetical protein
VERSPGQRGPVSQSAAPWARRVVGRAKHKESVVTHYISNGHGDSEDNPSPAVMRRFLDELDPSDEEHGAAWVAEDLERSLEWNVDGRLVFGDESSGPRHMLNVSKDRVVKLWQLLAEGRIAEIEREPWAPGNCPPLSREEEQQLNEDMESERRLLDREFFDGLGPERDNPRCRAQGCARGTVRFSAFCRAHHFKMIRGYACPFDDGAA